MATVTDAEIDAFLAQQATPTPTPQPLTDEDVDAFLAAPTDEDVDAYLATPPGAPFRALAYGPIVGEDRPSTRIGAFDNILGPKDVAVSPNRLREFGGGPFSLGQVVNAHDKDGKMIGNYRIADTSFFHPGEPTRDTVEFRDRDISNQQVFLSPSDRDFYETELEPAQEKEFQDWKAEVAPDDTGLDYDLRGAFKSNVTPDPKTGHWPDTFKKPNHPTFSIESQYAQDRPDLAGHWEGDKFVPPPAPKPGRTLAREYADYAIEQAQKPLLKTPKFDINQSDSIGIKANKAIYNTVSGFVDGSTSEHGLMMMLNPLAAVVGIGDAAVGLVERYREVAKTPGGSPERYQFAADAAAFMVLPVVAHTLFRGKTIQQKTKGGEIDVRRESQQQEAGGPSSGSAQGPAREAGRGPEGGGTGGQRSVEEIQRGDQGAAQADRRRAGYPSGAESTEGIPTGRGPAPTTQPIGNSEVPVRLAKAPKGKPPKAPKVEGGFPDYFDESPLIRAIIDDLGGIMSETGYLKSRGKELYEKNKSLYEDKPNFQNKRHNKIYASKKVSYLDKKGKVKVKSEARGGQTPDQAARELSGKFGLPENATSSDLWAAIQGESNTAVKLMEEQRGRAKDEAAAIGKSDQQEYAFKTDIAKPDPGEELLNVSDLNIDDVVDVNGVKLKVADVDEGGVVTLEDGNKYGIQQLEGDVVFYGKVIPEEATPAAAAEARVPAPEASAAATKAVNRAAETPPADSWTSATESINEAGPKLKLKANGEGGFINPDILRGAIDLGREVFQKGMDFGRWSARMVRELGEGVKPYLAAIWKEITKKPVDRFGLRIGGMANDLNMANGRHSAKLQVSTSEAERAQRGIDKIARKKSQREGMSIFREAGGDEAVIRDWLSQAKTKWFKKAAQAALDLTPEQKALTLGKIADTWNILEQRGIKHEILEGHRDNYVTHVWDVEKRFSGIGASKLRDTFKFAKARQFENFFAGDQAGWKPKTLDIGELLPAYLHEMNTVIADRQFIQEVSAGKADDNRPLTLPQGNSRRVDATEYAVMKPGQDRAVSVHDTLAEAEAAMPPPQENLPGMEQPGYTIEPRPATNVMVNPRGRAPLERDAAGNPIKIDDFDYRSLGDEQPALSAWRWMDTDAQGNAIYIKGDLKAHPDLAKRLNSMKGHSAIRKWYREPSKGLATVPKAFASGLDVAQSTMKREMFGLLSPFHQVQEATHAYFHWVNPIGTTKGGFVQRLGEQTTSKGVKTVVDNMANLDDMSKPTSGMIDGMQHGLMLKPEQRGNLGYGEGLGSRNTFISQISRKFGKEAGRVVADSIDGYQTYLFEQYIPALKWKTYQHILERNRGRYQKDIVSGKVSGSDVKMLSAEQANAAFGHLNKSLMDRNPTIQHLLQLGLLAPDFLEARARFVGQAMKAPISKAGHEQFRAIAVGAALQAGSAIVLAEVLGGHWDPKHPFEVTVGNRTYFLRSVPEDLFRAGAFLYGEPDVSASFVQARINPVAQKGIQSISRRNYRGEKVGFIDTIGETLAGYIPLSARPAPGVRELTQTSRDSPISPLEQFMGSAGLKVNRYSPITKTYQLARNWEKANDIPEDVGSYPVSKYQQLRYALEDDNLGEAKARIAELIQNGQDPKKLASGFRESLYGAFTTSRANDLKFAADLAKNDPEGKKLYDAAVARRNEIWARYKKVK